jgi:hypothetical protein
MGPWIHVLSIVAVDQTNLNQCIPLVEEELPRITDVAGYQSGARWGWAAPRWHRLALTYGFGATCQVPLLHESMFVTILAKFCHISYIQIILQAQVELGKI